MAEADENVTLQVDARALGELLARVAQQGRQSADTKAVFHLQPAALSVEWAGAREELPARGSGEVCVRVPLSVVIGLSRMLGSSGEATVAVVGDRLRAGRIGFGCERLDKPPPRLLGADASQLEVLLLGYREAPEAIAAAGLGDEVARLKRRVASSALLAAKHLDWLGATSEDLAEWIEGYLRAKAAR